MTTANLDAADLAAVARGGIIHEDVMDKIWDISQIPLPLTGKIGSDNVSNQYTSWTKDKLGAPDLTNAKIDGQDTDTENDTATGSRVGNHCQISTKNVAVSTRAQNVNGIGFASALSYQIMMRQRELRRDVEAISLSHQASVADTGAVAGKAGALGSWLETNVSVGATTGVAGGYNPGTGLTVAPIPGDVRPLSETLIRDIAESCYINNGNPTMIMTIPQLVRKISEYMFTSSARIATLQSDQKPATSAATAQGSVNVFVTDFGVVMELVPNRIMQPIDTDNCTAYLIDADYIRHGFLHGYRVEPLAKTGLADKRQMAVDWTLKVLNEEACGAIFDIDYTADVVA